MIINDSYIKFSAKYNFLEKHSVSESLNIDLNMPNNDVNMATKTKSVRDKIEISGKSPKIDNIESADERDEIALTPELRMIKLLLEKLMMKKINITQLDTDIPDKDEIGKSQPNSKSQISPVSIEYQYDESYFQSENSDFSAKGIVYTSDKKKINFDINFSLKREILIESSVNISIGKQKTKDPLIINFNGKSTDLTDSRFDFDIDLDNKLDKIPFVGSGSGFLAIDKNGDKKINDGNELFGPRTGNGFNELKDYDIDNNLWIDEKDPIYDRLLVWSKDNHGNDLIMGIRRKGIGAIYIGYEETPFKINDGQNNLNGLLRASGVYINEDGSVGTIQQIDLVT